MSGIAFKVQGKNGEYVKTALVPANHSEETHFGLLDGVVLGFFLLGVAWVVAFLVY